MMYELCLFPESYAVAQLGRDEIIPEWAVTGDIWAVVRTDDELSLVCRENQVPGDVRSESDWRVLKIMGPLDFSLIGILAGLAGVLADAGVSIFTLSTYNTDYILIKNQQVDEALMACRRAGYQVRIAE